MVRQLGFVLVVLSTCVVPVVGQEETTILSMELGSELMLRIKPCEPVSVLLTVFVSPTETTETIERIPRELARRVVIDGRAYARVGRGANEAAWFWLGNSSLAPVDSDKNGVEVGCLLYWNAADDDCLFRTPGEHRVEFQGDAVLNIVVEPPTAEEAKILEALWGNGAESGMFILTSDDRRSEALIPVVEQLLEQYPDTVYTPYLTIAVGMYKLTRERPEAGPDRVAWLTERRKVKKYFEPYVQDEISSIFELKATYGLATIAYEEVILASEGESEDLDARRRYTVALFEKIKASPYAADYHSTVASRLRSLRRMEETRTGDGSDRP